MAVSEQSGGSQSATISTEHTLATITAAGSYQVWVDLNTLANGDTVEIRVKCKIRSGESSRVVSKAVYVNAQGSDAELVYSDIFLVDQEVVVTLKQTAGTGRAFKWSIKRLDTPIYQAKIWLVDDDSAGTPTDRWLCVWHKDGEPVTSGITSPTIQVIKASDGSDLIASTSMSQIASTGLYKYDATTTARIADGAAYIAKVTASIDGATRTFYQPMSRDS